jgi:hypothetical protein
MKLNAARTMATLSIRGSFNTARVEKIIGDLLVLRASMEPPVPYDPPSRDDPNQDDTYVSVQNDPHLQLGRRRDESLRLYLRHQGLGWMVYEIPASKARGIRDFLVSRITGKEDHSGFFSKKIDDTDTPQ